MTPWYAALTPEQRALGSGRIFTIRAVNYPAGIFLDEIGYGWPPTAFTEVRE